MNVPLLPGRRLSQTDLMVSLFGGGGGGGGGESEMRVPVPPRMPRSPGRFCPVVGGVRHPPLSPRSILERAIAAEPEEEYVGGVVGNLPSIGTLTKELHRTSTPGTPNLEENGTDTTMSMEDDAVIGARCEQSIVSCLENILFPPHLRGVPVGMAHISRVFCATLARRETDPMDYTIEWCPVLSARYLLDSRETTCGMEMEFSDLYRSMFRELYGGADVPRVSDRMRYGDERLHALIRDLGGLGVSGTLRCKLVQVMLPVELCPYVTWVRCPEEESGDNESRERWWMERPKVHFSRLYTELSHWTFSHVSSQPVEAAADFRRVYSRIRFLEYALHRDDAAEMIIFD